MSSCHVVLSIILKALMYKIRQATMMSNVLGEGNK
jgi:hypothetical protein